MMRLILAAALIAGSLAVPAFAFWKGSGGGGGGCSHSLNFSQSCNSAYAVMVF